MSGTVKRRPRAMTQEELDADVKAAEEAALKEQEALNNAPAEPPTETPPAEPTPQTPEPKPAESINPDKPVETPAPVQPDNKGELESLKAAIAEREARIAELTKRVRDEDGKRGGELTQLREQVENLGSQLRNIVEENRNLRKQQETPAAPPEPDPLSEQYPELAKSVDKRTRPALNDAAEAKRLAQEAKEEALNLKKTQQHRDWLGFIDKVKSAVPNMDAHNSDPDFGEWCKGRNPGSYQTRQEVFNLCGESMDAGPAIQLYQQYEAEKKQASAPPPADHSKSPAKPSKEAQVEVPSAAAASTQPAHKPAVPIGNRIKQLEDKLFRFGTATLEDRLEYERLLDEQAKEQGAA